MSGIRNRRVEKEAIATIATVLTHRIKHQRWPTVLLSALRAAQRNELEHFAEALLEAEHLEQIASATAPPKGVLSDLIASAGAAKRSAR